MRDVGMGEHFFDEIQAYQSRYVPQMSIMSYYICAKNPNRFMPLLEAEQEEEEDVLKTRLSNWSTKRLEKEGYCLSQMSAFWLEANQYGRPVAVFSLGPGIALPQHRFESVCSRIVSSCAEQSCAGTAFKSLYRAWTHSKKSPFAGAFLVLRKRS